MYPLKNILTAGILIFTLSGSLQAQKDNSFAVRNCRIFNGASIEFGDVLVRDGLIQAVGKNIPIPETVTIIDGTGKTLLPGLIDSHVHIFTEYQLEQACIFGVTHMIDMFMDPEIMAGIKAQVNSPENHSLAGLTSPGMLATAPDGHGTQFGIDVPTLTATDQAQAWVDDRIAEGSDFIKIICEDGNEAYTFNSLSFDIIKAVIDAAHQRNMLAVVHIFNLDDAIRVINLGADGLAHLYAEGGYNSEFGRIAAARGLFVIPTLSVVQRACNVGDIQELIGDPWLGPDISSVDKMFLERTFPGTPDSSAYGDTEKAVRQLRDQAVPMLAGTDAPNPGTTYGPSLHRELKLLVEAGLSPLEALKSATSIPADQFNLLQGGYIKPGRAADLVLVTGDPTRDITATRALVSVWKNGWLIDRAAHRREVAAESY